MMRLCEADGSPDEPHTPEPITYESPINEDAVLEHEAKRLYNDNDDEHRFYGSEDDADHRFDGSYSYFYQPPTPPLPRSAPEYRSESFKGFTYDILDTDYPLPERPS